MTFFHALLAVALTFVAQAATPRPIVAMQDSSKPLVTTEVIPVRAGMRLNVDLAVGSITVRAWDRQEVRVTAERASDVTVVTGTTPGAINVTSHVKGRRPGNVQYRITVPRALPLTLGRGDVNVDVAGTEGEIIATVRDGAINIDGGRGLVEARTAHGAISIAHARGRISASTLNSDIHVADSAGDIQIEGSDGDVVLARLDADRVNASTVDGRITYEGPLRPGGHYTFATHDSGVRLSIPSQSGATITMATVTGSTASDFPYASRKELAPNRFSFVIGAGTAQVSLFSFEGLVEVRRTPTRR
jgi:hypothetical protein